MGFGQPLCRCRKSPCLSHTKLMCGMFRMKALGSGSAPVSVMRPKLLTKLKLLADLNGFRHVDGAVGLTRGVIQFAKCGMPCSGIVPRIRALGRGRVQTLAALIRQSGFNARSIVASVALMTPAPIRTASTTGTVPFHDIAHLCHYRSTPAEQNRKTLHYSVFKYSKTAARSSMSASPKVCPAFECEYSVVS